MGDIRKCAQCEKLFSPRREHARFCSPGCRADWNREHVGAAGPGEGVLEWAAAAMAETTEELLGASGWDEPDGLAVITEAVWWVTMVDATLVRYEPDSYGRALARHDPRSRKVIEDTLGGLRFVRNRMGHGTDHADFIGAYLGTSSSPVRRVADWHWKTVPESACPSLTARGQGWETTRHKAYQAQLAGQTVGETFARARAFLKSALQ